MRLLVPVLLVCALIGEGIVARPARAATLVAHWTFDETGGTTAHDATGAFDGTLAGGATFVAGGIAGNALSLAQATGGLVNVGTGFPGFTGGQDFSIVAWVNLTSTANDLGVLSKHESFSENGYFFAVNQTGGGGATTKGTFVVSKFVSQSPTSTTTVTDGSWHQIVGVYHAGGQQLIYVDGAPVEASSAASAVVGNGAPFLIGGVNESGSPVGRYTGLVDDVQVYDSALTDAEIGYLFAHPGRAVPTVLYDLATDWSDAANPNGVWTYREGTNALPHVASWQSMLGGYTAPQPGWARSQDGTDRIPFWHKSLGVENFANDIQAGDVVCHTTDGANGIGQGNGNVIWTSPFTGAVDLSGWIWMGRDIGRGNQWLVYRNQTLLTEGSVASGDAFDRDHPMPFTSGSGGAAALSDVTVATGDTIRLELAKTGSFGDYSAMHFAIAQVPTPTPTATPTPSATPTSGETSVVSYFLPKSVKLKLAGAGKDTLALSGSFDDGDLPADFTQPVTIELGAFTRTVMPAASGAAFKFKDDTLALVLKPRLKGSSRGAFTLKVSKATLVGLVDPAAELTMHLRVGGLPDALGVVRLTNGAFKLGKARGDLVAPALFPAKATAAISDVKEDRLSLVAGFAAPGPTPATIGDVSVAFGDVLSLAIAGTSFTRKGDVFTHATKGNGVTIAMSLDFARGLLKLKVKGSELGTFAAGTADVVLDAGNGSPPVRVHVRLGGTAAKRVY